MAFSLSTTDNRYLDVDNDDESEGYLSWAGVWKILFDVIGDGVYTYWMIWDPPVDPRPTDAITTSNLRSITRSGPRTYANGYVTQPPGTDPIAFKPALTGAETGTNIPRGIRHLMSMAKIRFDSLPWRTSRWDPADFYNTPPANNLQYNVNKWQWPRLEADTRYTTSTSLNGEWYMPTEIGLAFVWYCIWLGIVRIMENRALSANFFGDTDTRRSHSLRNFASNSVPWQLKAFARPEGRLDGGNPFMYRQGFNQESLDFWDGLFSAVITARQQTIPLGFNNAVDRTNNESGERITINDMMIDMPFICQAYLAKYVVPGDTRITLAELHEAQAELARMNTQIGREDVKFKSGENAVLSRTGEDRDVRKITEVKKA